MRLIAPIFVFALLAFASSQAGAAQSCSAFATFEAYDSESKMAEVEFESGKERSFFPLPEGAPQSNSKLPKKCSRKITKKTTSFLITPTGGRMSVTQVRMNFSGKMLNDTEDPNWLAPKLNELIESKTKVVIVLRPGPAKDSPTKLTTIYMPITPEEEAEIERIDAQAEDI